MQFVGNGERLGDGKPALNTVEKSAEGVVGSGEGSNPQSRPKAQTVPREGIERERWFPCQ